VLLRNLRIALLHTHNITIVLLCNSLTRRSYLMRILVIVCTCLSLGQRTQKLHVIEFHTYHPSRTLLYAHCRLQCALTIFMHSHCDPRHVRPWRLASGRRNTRVTRAVKGFCFNMFERQICQCHVCWGTRVLRREVGEVEMPTG
jgi:hypothetical protein